MNQAASPGTDSHQIKTAAIETVAVDPNSQVTKQVVLDKFALHRPEGPHQAGEVHTVYAQNMEVQVGRNLE